MLILLLVVFFATGSMGYAAAREKTPKEPKQKKELGYNRLLKSNDVELKYRRALEYFNMRKVGRNGKERNPMANYERCGTLLEQVQPYFVGTARDDSVAYYIATSLYKSGSFDLSSAYFDQFRRRFPSSVFIEDVEYMYALGFYYSSPDPEFDQSTTMQAIISINEYLERYPASRKKESLEEKKQELVQKLHDKSYMNAKVYYTIGKYKSAVAALNNAIDKYPESNHREELMYLVAKSQYLLSKNSVAHLQLDRYLSMLDDYYNFVSEYPDSKYLKELDKMQEEAKEFIAAHRDGKTETESEYGIEEK